MSGPRSYERLTCEQNIDFSETRFFFTSPASGSTDPQNLAPLDFTGCSARMSIRLAQDSSSALLQSLTSGGGGITFVSGTFTPGPPLPTVPNGVQIVITKLQSLNMNGGVAVTGAYYDLQIDFPGSPGTTMLLMAGPFDLMATVSR